MIPTAFNCFMNVPVDGTTGTLKVLPPLSKAGDHIVFEAQDGSRHRAHRLLGAGKQWRVVQADPLAGRLTAVAARERTPASAEPRARLRRLRVGLLYWWRHGRWPDLDRPRTVHRVGAMAQAHTIAADRLTMLTDKLHSKSFVAKRCGMALPVPTLWQGTELPAEPPGALPLVVKANHGCGQMQVVRELRRLATGAPRRPPLGVERLWRMARRAALSRGAQLVAGRAVLGGRRPASRRL